MEANKREIVYVTGNKLKVDILKKFLNQDEFNVVSHSLDVPEIQADSSIEVAKHSAKYASDLLRADVLKNDSGLVIPALNGFPGPYSKFVENSLLVDGLLAVMSNQTDRYCYYLDAFAYCEYGKEPVVFVSKTEGEIATEPSGDYGSSFDKLFVPKGKTYTMANMDYDEFVLCFDKTGVEQLAEYLKNKQ